MFKLIATLCKRFHNLALVYYFKKMIASYYSFLGIGDISGNIKKPWRQGFLVVSILRFHLILFFFQIDIPTLIQYYSCSYTNLGLVGSYNHTILKFP